MKVRELLEKLKNVDPELEVLTPSLEDEHELDFKGCAEIPMPANSVQYIKYNFKKNKTLSNKARISPNAILISK